MVGPDFKYDVAFSFLQEDEGLAIQLDDLLKDRLKTFIYSERQLEVAGTDGETLFNQVFGRDARSAVVLHRAAWGSTPWTRIEETAIRNRGHEYGYDFVLFIPLDKPAAAPVWLPKNRIWISMNRWGLDTAAAIIEARVQELGGSPHEESVEELALRLQQQTEFARRRQAFLDSEPAVKLATDEFFKLCAEVDKVLLDVKAAAPRFAFKIQEDRHLKSVVGGGRTVSFLWHQAYRNLLRDSKLAVTFWEGHASTNEIVLGSRAKQIRTWAFDPEVDVGQFTGWRSPALEERLFSTEDLVARSFKQLLQDVQSLHDEQQRQMHSGSAPPYTRWTRRRQ
jgi:hypothetical protein